MQSSFLFDKSTVSVDLCFYFSIVANTLYYTFKLTALLEFEENFFFYCCEKYFYLYSQKFNSFIYQIF